MKKKYFPTVIILFLVFFGFILRIWNVGHVPAALNRDEAALAYNALLLKETGKDEWGRTWPVALESFGDYKLLGYPVLLIGSFTFFGLNDLSVRLPSVLAGTLLIIVSYIFAKKVVRFQTRYALFLSFLVALQPVFFFYSRSAFEANVALLFFVSGMLLLFAKTRINHFVQMTLASLFFLLAVFTYNTPLLLLPFLLPMILFWCSLKNVKGWFLPIIEVCGVILVGFVSLFSLSKQKSGITIFSNEQIHLQADQYHTAFSGVMQHILGNKIFFFGRLIIERYIQAFSPNFLVFHGGSHPWHQLPGFAHLSLFVYVLGAIGIVITSIHIFQKRKEEILLLFLLFIAPLPASVTVDAPHATRSLLFFFLWLFFAVRALEFISQYSEKKWKKTAVPHIFFIIVVLFSAARYFYSYFSFYPEHSYELFKGGYSKVLEDVHPKSQTRHVAVLDDGGYQYILTAWYTKMLPKMFFQTIERHNPDKIGFSYGYKIGNYRFIKAPTDKNDQEKILVFWNDATHAWQIDE